MLLDPHFITAYTMPLGNVRFSALQKVFSALPPAMVSIIFVPYMWVTLETISNRIPDKQQGWRFTFF